MFGINKFWIWLAILGGTAYYGEYTATTIIWMGGCFYFFAWLLVGGPDQFQLQPGTWVKSVTQENGMTILTITDGKEDSIQQYTSSKVAVTGNIITVG